MGGANEGYTVYWQMFVRAGDCGAILAGNGKGCSNGTIRGEGRWE